MILQINGKRVGGMTLEGLEIELEVAGPVVSLIVSRYKYSDEADDEIRKTEKAYLDAIDKAVNDDTRLDWVELGTVPASKPACKVLKGPASVHVGETCDSSISSSTDPVAENFSIPAVDANPPVRPVSTTNEKEPASLTLSGSNSLGTSPDESPSGSSAADNEVSVDKEQQEDDDDDGHAWLGCVCGVVHDVDVPVFWIQCDRCQSWYNVAEECVDMKSEDAIALSRFTCWGCPADEGSIVSSPDKRSPTLARKARSPEALAAPKPEKKAGVGRDYLNGRIRDDGCLLPKKPPKKRSDGTYGHPCGTKPRGYCWDATEGVWIPLYGRPIAERLAGRENVKMAKPIADMKKVGKGSTHPSKTKLMDDCSVDTAPYSSVKNKNPAEVFAVGDIVMIEEHAWPGVSNPAGIAQVTKEYVDEDGDHAYDVKYIIGRHSQGILAQYVARHSWQCD